MIDTIQIRREWRRQFPDLIKCSLGSVLFYSGYVIDSGLIYWAHCSVAAVCWICSVLYWLCIIAPLTSHEIGLYVHVLASIIFVGLITSGLIFGANFHFIGLWIIALAFSAWRVYRLNNASVGY